MKPFPSTVRRLSAVLAMALCATPLTSLTLAAPASAATQATYYVAPDGSDTNAGTISAPFKTLRHARDVVRTVNDDMTGDINVYLRGGNYPVSSTIDFTSADSGTNGHRVVYAAYQNEKPVLNGGVPVTGWTQHSGNIWKASLDRDDKLRALYVDGKRAQMASKTIDSAGCQGTYSVTAGQAPWAWESGSHCDGAKYSLSDLPAIAANQDDVEIKSATTWTTAIVGVRQITTSSDGANRVAQFQQPGAAIAQAPPYGPFKAGGSHTFMNAYEFLDKPGEFYFNKTTHTLYYYKSGSEDMTTAEVFAPNNVTTLLKIAGTSRTDHARNITFSGLTVEHSDWNLVNVAGSVFRQSTQGNTISKVYAKKNFHAYTYRNVDLPPAAVQIENADGITLQRNTVQHTGADGITLANDVTDSQLTGNVTNDIAGSAITVGHPQHVYIGDYTSTNNEKYPVNVEGLCKNISITNNYLYDSGALFEASSPVSAYFVDSLSVEHNRIEKSPWAGITLGWGWWNFDGSTNSINPGNPTTTAKNNTIKYNELFDTMQVLGDSAPIYTLGSQPGTEISGNYIQGVPAGHKYGLHPDEGSAFINYHDNVFDVDPGLAYTVNSGTWGRQHDLSITNNYGTLNKIAGRNVPNSTIQDVRGYGDNVWPSQAYAIALNAGLEEAYKDLLPTAVTAPQDYALPASTFAGTGVMTIPVRSPKDATKTLWLAPAGTTTFAAGPTKTSASGTSTSIRVPQTAGDYRLYVVNAQGNASPASKALVRQRWSHVDDKAAGVTYSGTWSNWNDSRDMNGSEKVTSTAGNYAEFSFTGTGVRYLSMTQPNMGKVDVYIDGTLTQAGIDAYAPTVTKQVPLFEKTNLAAGPHTIRVVCTGTKNASSSNTVCALDAFASISFPATNANYKLVNKSSNKAIDVSGGSLTAGANVIQWTDSGAGNQNWRFVPVGNGSYEIVSRNSGLLMDVSGASTADGATVIQSSDTNAANQRWTLVADGNGYYKIKNVNSGKLLSVPNSTAGTQLVQTTDTNADGQLWRAVNVD
ncbi:right-handed parallel beta-helix repeat-containing protein [Streptomyces cyaneochromogenes]|uniref:Right-handed parallel beta-helix repeat-containing protein n=1 Tax=Streptomyces cyaneochromogenes TaxID=2496836 RepID=A0A3Q9ELH0_9ACTN|nr:RICIN domain-containing protein [Streptomyces cyaneochromogenes]AZQ33079.1 right-handed parallel beta-helix repeat-containing protein [Streptomyces cyaneochromogenes]